MVELSAGVRGGIELNLDLARRTAQLPGNSSALANRLGAF